VSRASLHRSGRALPLPSLPHLSGGMQRIARGAVVATLNRAPAAPGRMGELCAPDFLPCRPELVPKGMGRQSERKVKRISFKSCRLNNHLPVSTSTRRPAAGITAPRYMPPTSGRVAPPESRFRGSSCNHVEWVDGKVHETGFTTVYTP